MNIISELRERLRVLFFRRREERELDEELRFHIEMETEANIRRGMDPQEARRRAHLKLGGVERTKEEVRDARGTRHIETLARDTRVAARRLVREPAFSVPVILTLALGIGAVAAIFSVVDATLLRPLPFQDDDRLVRLRSVRVPTRMPGLASGPKQTPDITDLDSLRHVFSTHAVYAPGGLNLSGAGEPRRVAVALVTPGFFSTLGVAADLGRPFNAAEGTPEGARAAILSHGIWRSHFGADPDVVDATVTLNGVEYRVVGVMPAGFGFPGETEIWLPYPVPITPPYWEPFGEFIPSTVIARLAPGVTVAQAGERMHALFSAYRPPEAPVPAAAEAVRPLRGELVAQRRTAMLVLLGATGLMLLIACANAAGLLLARAARRRRELALRAALGASSGRLLQQLLIDSGLLAVAGGLLGLGIAYAGTGALDALVPAGLAGSVAPGVDARVLAFALAATLASAVAFGIWPALRARKVPGGEAIRAGDGTVATGRGATRLRRGFVAGQVAVALVLLVGAGVMIRSFRAVLAADPGLDPERVATLEVSLANAKYTTRAALDGFYDRVLEHARAIPGVEAAAIANQLPLRGGGGIRLLITPEGERADGGSEPIFADYILTTPDYFRTLRIPFLSGRPFRRGSGTAAVHEAVVGSRLARRLWPGEDSIGKRFRSGSPDGDSPWRTVVGVVADVRQQSLDETEHAPQLYLPLGANTADDVTVLARGDLAAAILGDRLREAVRAVDPSQAVYNVRPMKQVIARTLAPRRTTTRLVSAFGVLALLLAAVGVYGLIAFEVARRRAELGIRLALGARPARVAGLVVGEGFVLALLGAAVGAPIAFALSRTLDSLLFEITAQDPVAFAVAPAVLIGVATLAALPPAVRASRSDPVESLRTD